MIIKMPPALLLLRENSTTTTSLASLVEKSQKCQPLICYNLELTTTKLDLIPQQQQQQQQKNDHKISDEGFESDIDTVSVISSDGSLVSTTTTTIKETTQTTTTKIGETDSANGSASSDSDTDHLLTTNDNNTTSVHRNKYPTTTTTTTNYYNESYNLVDCVCYSDIRVPDVLLFVIKNDVFVFKFENLLKLRNFYLNFTALKALTNQKTYNCSNFYNNNNNNNVGITDNNNSKNGGKFNLLQRTDNNGVTHIEITRELEQTTKPAILQQTNNTNIISLNTPEIDYNQLKHQSSGNTVKLAQNLKNNNNSLRKVWNSADDLLGDSPKRPERRRRVKGRAPPPPIYQQQQQQQQQKITPISDVLRGEYVRVNVNVDTIKNSNFIAKSQLKEKPKLTNFVTLLTTTKPKTTTKTTEQQLWMNSVPRLIKIKHNKNGQNSKLPPLRSRSETRHFPPMAYRYIDQSPTTTTTTNSISNRLFGLSSKLKDFHLESKIHSKWCSVNDISMKNDTNLKSVIKKDDNRKKNDKKVTFSAYTTVQVV